MTEQQPTHRLDVRVEDWTKDELHEPGLISPKITRTDHYRGTMDDCDLAALAAGAPLLAYDLPATADSPFDDRTYLHERSDGSLIEVWCRGRSLRSDVSPWVNSLPLLGEVFVYRSVVGAQEAPTPLMPADVASSPHDL
jgi:hypothetical protein